MDSTIAQAIPALDQGDASASASDCVYSNWSPCSVDCDGGTQTRELISGSESACIELIQPCHTHSCCDTAGCPIECGFEGDPEFPDGCGGILDCPATEPCDTTEEELAETGCSLKGQKCGDEFGACCEGLVCWGGNGESRCRNPIDCEGSWGDCVGDNCGVEGIRFFNVTNWPSFGGEPCPDPMWQSCITAPCTEDCQGHWGECEGECGTGVKTYIIDKPAEEGGKECPFEDGAQQECYDLPPCPVDCEGGWDECQGDCGTGSRTYQIYVPAQNGGKECLFEEGYSEDCELEPCKIDCQGEWGACEGECGEKPGVKTFTVSSLAQAGGAACEAEDGDTLECQTDPCPINCQGAWSISCFGACDSNDVAAYMVLTDAQWGGEECEFENGETRVCENVDCAIQTLEDSGPIPVTGSGLANDKYIRNPFIGTKFGEQLANFQRFSLHFGMLFFGISLVLEGISKKFDN